VLEVILSKGIYIREECRIRKLKPSNHFFVAPCILAKSWLFTVSLNCLVEKRGKGYEEKGFFPFNLLPQACFRTSSEKSGRECDRNFKQLALVQHRQQ
jgi:hypothetical protein